MALRHGPERKTELRLAPQVLGDEGPALRPRDQRPAQAVAHHLAVAEDREDGLGVGACERPQGQALARRILQRPLPARLMRCAIRKGFITWAGSRERSRWSPAGPRASAGPRPGFWLSKVRGSPYRDRKST